ncbi:MAG: hypothetical protein U0694_01355 [Anaerolineae bacterium]
MDTVNYTRHGDSICAWFKENAIVGFNVLIIAVSSIAAAPTATNWLSPLRWPATAAFSSWMLNEDRLAASFRGLIYDLDGHRRTRLAIPLVTLGARRR